MIFYTVENCFPSCFIPYLHQVAEKQKQPRWTKAAQNITMEKAVIDAIIEERDRRKKSRRIKKGFKKVLKFFLSTSGLLLLNALVMVLGAFIFQHLEHPNELAACVNMRRDYYIAEDVTLDKLMGMAMRLDTVGELSAEGEEEVIEYFQRYLKSFALSVLETGYRVTKDCELIGTEEGEGCDWSFTGSLVFTLTVITTIGEFI